MSILADGLAFIFDVDGVVVDSNPSHREAWVAYNLQYGIETTEEMHARMYGKHNGDIVRDFFGAKLPAAEVAARGAAKEKLYRELVAGRVHELLVPGLEDFLEEFREVPMGIASNAEPENIELILERSGLRRFFGVVVDGHQVQKPKPDPEIYLHTAELMGIAPANCIVFEDSHAGVAAGVAAGMRIVGVCTTHGNLPGTTITIDNFGSGDLRRWLMSQTRVN